MSNSILGRNWRDKSKPMLPEPWVHLGTVEADRFDALESAAGSEFTTNDLSPDEQSGEVKTSRSIQVLDRRWVSIQNVDNDAVVYLRLQGRDAPEEPSVRVSSVVFPFQAGKDLTGSDLRSVPVQALTAAYSIHEDEGSANMLRGLVLMGSLDEDPLAPLPQASAEDSFTARAARQYVALEEQHPDQNPIDIMVELNGAAKSSVQRWVTRARKRGLLPPTVQGRRRG